MKYPNYKAYFLCALMCASSNLQAYELLFETASSQQFAHPHDLTLGHNQRYLYVSDNGNDRIAVLDPQRLELLGVFGETLLSQPHDVVLMGKDRLLVADTGHDRIALFTITGAVQAQFNGELKGDIISPEGVAVHPNGRIYASGAGSGNVVAYLDGKVVAKYEGLSAPHDICVAPDGSLWVADSGNDRLIQMDEDLKIKKILSDPTYGFKGPRYLGFDMSQRLYVADKYSHQIKVLNPDNKLIYVLGSGRAGMGAALFNHPEGVVIHDQTVWFSDTYNNRIVRYRIN